MVKGLYTAYTGLRNEQNRMDILTNNLANATTIGYKKEGTTSEAFHDVLAYKIKDASVGLSNVQRLGTNNLGVKIGENYTDYTQGSYRVTNNTYDLGLDGDGFFAVEFTNKAGETSTKYTRAGNFTLNREGYLVTQEGDFVLGTNNQRIMLNNLLDSEISETGIISQNGVNVAQLQITDFEDYDYLEKYGENYYQPVEGATTVNSQALVNSGCLEMSNVQIVREMVDMISLTRSYETNQKVMQTNDQTLEVAVTQLGRL